MIPTMRMVMVVMEEAVAPWAARSRTATRTAVYVGGGSPPSIPSRLLVALLPPPSAARGNGPTSTIRVGGNLVAGFESTEQNNKTLKKSG